MSHLHLILNGKVQGMGLKLAIQMKAQALSLTGFARNLDSGSIEILVLGNKEGIKEFLSWIKQSAETKITSIEEEQREKAGRFTKFNVF